MDSGQLLERLLEPGNEGRQWFFFERRALGAEWLRERLRITANIAHDRYTPQHHVSLPIASVIDGCAAAPGFVSQLKSCADDVAEALPRTRPLAQALPAGLNEADAASFAKLYVQMSDDLTKAAEGATRLQVEAAVAGPARMLASAMAEAVSEVGDRLSRARETSRQLLHLRNRAVHTPDYELGRPSSAGPRPWTPDDTQAVEKALAQAKRLQALCLSDAAQAAEANLWVLLGEAGQGKTHLLVDATRRALDEDRPAVTVFGEQLTTTDPLTQIGQQLGLGALSHTTLLQAMDAAGAASDSSPLATC
ncbi:hypothetical protein [Streptomyces gardneri]|uniref:hypothetical protein n=1 Tax=Streptomyces gardneri TaxID=66892 RepID=UPI0035E03B8C